MRPTAAPLSRVDVGSVRAYAKVNLCLDVIGKRPDGMHEVATVMQTVSLADRLRFSLSADLSLHCRGMVTGPDNLILRAANLLRTRVGERLGARILCEKRIPVGAGLGGGSSDAAATLLALNVLWNLGLDQQSLSEVASQIGSDVPFFLRGGTGLATGTGTEIEPLGDAPPLWVVLFNVGSGPPDKTAAMYRKLQDGDFTDGSRCRGFVVALQAGDFDPTAIASSFWGPATRTWPSLERVRDEMLSAGALGATLSGSGPSIFALFSSRGMAIRCLRVMRRDKGTARLCQFVPARGRTMHGALDGRGRGQAAAPTSVVEPT